LKGYTLRPTIKNPFWLGSCIFKKRLLETYSLQDIRNISRTKRIKGVYLKNGGWHFSFMGDINYIKHKVINYAHQEFNTPEIVNEDNIAQKIAEGMSLFDDAQFEFIPIDSPQLPVWIRENHSKFPHLVGKPTAKI
jgi:beta-1,4-mannosyl-glycoprotein beta-1,4-N-acetylglucosaminyltransferase